MYLFECFVAYTNMIHVWIFYLSSPAFWHHRMKCDKRTSGLIQQAFRACRHYKNPLKLYISKLAAKQQSYNPICFGLALLVSNAIRTSVNCMLMFCQPHPPPHIFWATSWLDCRYEMSSFRKYSLWFCRSKVGMMQRSYDLFRNLSAGVKCNTHCKLNAEVSQTDTFWTNHGLTCNYEWSSLKNRSCTFRCLHRNNVTAISCVWDFLYWFQIQYTM